MSWQVIALIAIMVGTLLCIPIFILMWRIFGHMLKLMDDITDDAHHMRETNPRETNPFEDMEEQVRKLTGPSENPFQRNKYL